MKLILLLIMGCLFIGCSGGEDVRGKQMQENDKNSKLVHGYVINIIEYDGCQYIVSGIGYSQMITHKGNCNNPIHNIKQ